MATVDVTTFKRGYTNRDNKLNTSSNTGNTIVNEGTTTSPKYDNPAQSYKTIVDMGRSPRDYGYGTPAVIPQPDYGNTGSTGSGGGAGGGDSSYKSSADSLLQNYLDMLKKAYEGYRTSQDDLLKQKLAETDQSALESRERNNLNSKYAERRVKNIYGDNNSGARDSSMSRVWANWLNGGSDIERDRLNNRQTHQINHTQAMANNDQNYANALYSLYSTDRNADRQLELQKYLLSLG